jgi:tetratricopeptide (TPR) repeat protein
MKRPDLFVLSLMVIGAFAIVPAVTAARPEGTNAQEIIPAGSPDASAYIAWIKAADAKRDWSESNRLVTEALALYPNNATLLCMDGYSLRKAGRYEEAVTRVSEAINLDPEPVRYANRGYSYLALGDYQDALADADRGISLDEKYPVDYSVRALALAGLGRQTEAILAIDKGLRLVPENSSDAAYLEDVLGKVLGSMGECQGAKTAFERSIALDPSFDPPWPAFPGARTDLAVVKVICSTPATR